MSTNKILLELSAWKARAEKAEKELVDIEEMVHDQSEREDSLQKELAALKAKPDCTGCIRANGGEPVDVYHGTCFYCCRPDWSNTDYHEKLVRSE